MRKRHRSRSAATEIPDELSRNIACRRFRRHIDQLGTIAQQLRYDRIDQDRLKAEAVDNRIPPRRRNCVCLLNA